MRTGHSTRPCAALIAMLAFLLCALPLRAQITPSAAAVPSTAATAAPADDALPRLEEAKLENPFSRFEIVTLGSFPITIFYADLGFDLKAWIASGYNSAYAPIVGATNSSLTDSQRLQRLGVALGISFLVGTIDAIIHASKVKAAKRLRDARMSIDAGAIPTSSGTQ